MARDLFREKLPVIPAKYLKEEFQARSELARVLSIQATAEYGIYHIMAAKVTHKNKFFRPLRRQGSGLVMPARPAGRLSPRWPRFAMSHTE